MPPNSNSEEKRRLLAEMKARCAALGFSPEDLAELATELLRSSEEPRRRKRPRNDAPSQQPGATASSAAAGLLGLLADGREQQGQPADDGQLGSEGDVAGQASGGSAESMSDKNWHPEDAADGSGSGSKQSTGGEDSGSGEAWDGAGESKESEDGSEEDEDIFGGLSDVTSELGEYGPPEGVSSEDEGEEQGASGEQGTHFIHEERVITEEEWGRLRQVADAPITYRKAPCTLAGRLNFHWLDDRELSLARCVSEPGSWVNLSTEQSDKTAAAAAIMVTARLLGYQAVIIVVDKKCNVEELEGKLGELLRGTGEVFPQQSEAKFLAGAKGPWRMMEGPLEETAFLNGQRIPVVLGSGAAIENLYNYINKTGAKDVVLILDEADVMWQGVSKLSRREVAMYKLLGDPALLNGARIRCFISQSATHMTTVCWHKQWGLPFKKLVAVEQKLRDNGYTSVDDLEPVTPHLTDEDVIAKNGYGFRAPQVTALLNEFGRMRQEPARNLPLAQQKHIKALQKKGLTSKTSGKKIGRLMQVSLTPNMNTVTTNNFNIAAEVLKHVPDAVCIVVSAKGCTMLRKGHRVRELTKCVGEKEHSMHVSEAIAFADEEYGLHIPVVVLGQNCLIRCVSVRSQHRVITHAIMNMTDRRTTADMEQMCMRPGGLTKRLRELNGFGNVKLLCRGPDFRMLRHLYEFTVEVLNLTGTAAITDLDKYETATFPGHLRAVAESGKPLARKEFDWQRQGMRFLGGDGEQDREEEAGTAGYILGGEGGALMTYNLLERRRGVVQEWCPAQEEERGFVANLLGCEEDEVMICTGVKHLDIFHFQLFSLPAAGRFMQRLDHGARTTTADDQAKLRFELLEWVNTDAELSRAMGYAETQDESVKLRIVNLEEASSTTARSEWWQRGVSILFVPHVGAEVVYISEGKDTGGTRTKFKAWHELHTDGGAYTMRIHHHQVV